MLYSDLLSPGSPGSPGFPGSPEIPGSTVSTTTSTRYLYDPSGGHTGYAQVLEETDGQGNLTRSYTLGHDVLRQTTLDPGPGTMDPVIFLYDAHGSTRMLLTPAGTAARMGTTETKSVDGYTYSSKPVFVVNYDAYGRMLAQYEYDDDYSYQMIPLAILPGSLATSLLYSGELTDSTTGLQYLRARYYDPASGRFPTLDPFAGNTSDPLSLHKYLYTHGNPVMGVDPSGMFALVATLGTISIGAFIQASLVTSVGRQLSENSSSLATVLPWTEYEATYEIDGFPVGAPLGLAVWLGLNNDKSTLTPIAQFMGSALLNDANARAWYNAQVAALPRSQGRFDPAREDIKISTRSRLTPIGQAWTESFNKARSLSADIRQAGRNTSTNQIANQEAFRNFRPLGGALMVIGASVSVYNITTANDPFRQFVVESGAWAGALSGGLVGSKIGATIGSVPIFLPWGPFVGAIAGGVIGSWLGGNAVAVAAGNYYEFIIPSPRTTP